jgi:hypothetical protein
MATAYAVGHVAARDMLQSSRLVADSEIIPSVETNIRKLMTRVG